MVSRRLVDEGPQDAGRDSVVSGDVLVVGVAGDEVFGGDEAGAGVDAVDLVEGVDGKAGELESRSRGRGGSLLGCNAKHWGLPEFVWIWMRASAGFF